ncbi:hypothetical protein KKG16_03160, partial [Patescibacteria group bacterium]|nr:hypothetical protein [Patescibacteria group bacterium]
LPNSRDVMAEPAFEEGLKHVCDSSVTRTECEQFVYTKHQKALLRNATPQHLLPVLGNSWHQEQNGTLFFRIQGLVRLPRSRIGKLLNTCTLRRVSRPAKQTEIHVHANEEVQQQLSLEELAAFYRFAYALRHEDKIADWQKIARSPSRFPDCDRAVLDIIMKQNAALPEYLESVLEKLQVMHSQ